MKNCFNIQKYLSGSGGTARSTLAGNLVLRFRLFFFLSVLGVLQFLYKIMNE